MVGIEQELLAWKAAPVGAWFALLFLAERLWPAAPRARHEARDRPEGGPWRRMGDPRRLGRNGGLWFLNLGLGPLVVVPLSAWATGLDLGSLTLAGWRPGWWQGWVGLGLDIVVLEFWIYWWHRANHEVPFLWRFHEVHHLDRFLDTSTAVRFHFGEVVLSALVRAVVIVLLGLPLVSVVVFEALILAAALFHHSNLALPARIERPLSWLVITPSIHWVHHHAVRRDTDSNYGTVFSFWDRLFGTRSPTPRTPAMAIGVEARGEEPFLRLLTRPFRPTGGRRAPPS